MRTPNPARALFDYFTAPAGSPSAKAHTGRLFTLSAFVSIALSCAPVVHFIVTGREWPKGLLDFVADVVFWLPATMAGVYSIRQGMNVYAAVKQGNGGLPSNSPPPAAPGPVSPPTGGGA